MKKSKLTICAVALMLVAGAGARAADTASISGKVGLDGDAPKAKNIKMDADPKCAELHADEPAKSQEVVVNDDGTLRNVFVYVKSGLAGKTYEKPSTPVELDQQGCIYTPRVFGMQAKQMLVIKNNDDTLHNVHAMPANPNNKEFNVGQPNKGMEAKKTFAAPEVMVKFKCDVHPWMSAYVGVLDHPFYATTGEDGSFSLKNLPAGEYVVAAWHEKYGAQEQAVKVGDGEAKTVDFKFKASE
jgi:hypothetical protein